MCRPSTRVTLDFLSMYAQVPLISLIMSLASILSVLAKKKLRVSKLSSFRLQVNNWCLMPHVGSTKGSSLITKLVECAELIKLKQDETQAEESRKRKKGSSEVRIKH
jgi:hypothetical protein